MKITKGRLTVTSITASLILLLAVGVFGNSFLTKSFDASIAVAAPGDPTDGAIATTETLINALVAAVFSISDATVNPEDVGPNSEVVSLLLAPGQDNYRLIDASGGPLNPNNVARGNFERSALAELVATGGLGSTVQDVVGNQLRTLFALTNNAHPNCVTCHENYAGLPSGTVIGAISTRVK